MHLTVFLEYLQDNGAVYWNEIEIHGFTWMYFTNLNGTKSCQILTKLNGNPKEFVTKREADIHCDKLKIRKLPGGAFEY